MASISGSIRRRRVRRVVRQVTQAIERSQGDEAAVRDDLRAMFSWLLLFELGMILLKILLELYTKNPESFRASADMIGVALSSSTQCTPEQLALASEDAEDDGLFEFAKLYRWLNVNYDRLGSDESSEWGEVTLVEEDEDD